MDLRRNFQCVSRLWLGNSKLLQFISNNINPYFFSEGESGPLDDDGGSHCHLFYHSLHYKGRNVEGGHRWQKLQRLHGRSCPCCRVARHRTRRLSQGSSCRSQNLHLKMETSHWLYPFHVYAICHIEDIVESNTTATAYVEREAGGWNPRTPGSGQVESLYGVCWGCDGCDRCGGWYGVSSHDNQHLEDRALQLLLLITRDLCSLYLLSIVKVTSAWVSFSRDQQIWQDLMGPISKILDHLLRVCVWKTTGDNNEIFKLNWTGGPIIRLSYYPYNIIYIYQQGFLIRLGCRNCSLI